jgi:hypothetical protein
MPRFHADTTNATDVRNLSLAGTNSLPSGVVPVSKALWLDVQAELVAAGKVRSCGVVPTPSAHPDDCTVLLPILSKLAMERHATHTKHHAPAGFWRKRSQFACLCKYHPVGRPCRCAGSLVHLTTTI